MGRFQEGTPGPVSFVGTVSGDGECFLWRDVSKEDKIAIVGEANYQSDWRLEEDFQKEEAKIYGREYDRGIVERVMQRLYPGDVMIALGVKPEKKYRFTVIAEEIAVDDQNK